jgi:hypothetical protein
LLCSLSYSQDWEYGIMFGGANYHGDLAYNVVPQETNLAVGLHMRHNFNSYWSMRPSFMYGTISGNDANFEEYKWRNLSFENQIFELGGIFEYNFLPFGSRTLDKDFTPYVMAGLSVFRHNPTAEFRGERYDLRDLFTEGQTPQNQYKLFQVSIPFGGGFKYNLTKNFVLAFEVGWRRTFTDYLDDVSTLYPDLQEQTDNYGSISAAMSDRSWEVEGVGEPLSRAGDERGDPALKDYYFFTTFNLSYRFTPIHCWPPFKKQYLFK